MTISVKVILQHLVTAAVLCGLVCLSIGYQGCASEKPEQTNDLVLHEGYIDASDDVHIYYRLIGTGSDTLVVVHGGPGFNMDYFFADLQPLASDLTLIFYDQRGTGRSSLVDDSMSLAASWFAEDLEAVRTHFGLHNLNIMGHSWGAGVAGLYGMRFPGHVGRLVIVGGVPLRQEHLAAAFSEMQARRDSAELQEMRDLYAARRENPENAELCRAYYELWFRPFYGDPAAAGQSRGDFCSGSREALRNKMESVDRFTEASLGNWDWRDSLSHLDAPTLVMHGTADPLPVSGSREWALTLPNARLLLFDGIGHFPYLEAPDQFFPAVQKFIQGEWPAEAVKVDNR